MTPRDVPAREGPWTAYVCPECGSVCASRLTAEVHAATICDPDSWPWQPVQVISLATAEEMAEVLEAAREGCSTQGCSLGLTPLSPPTAEQQEEGPMADVPAEGVRLIYVCPECEHVEGDAIWDAAMLADSGPPACPHSGVHGQLDMQPVQVIPLATAVLVAERALCDARTQAEASNPKARRRNIEALLHQATGGGTDG